MDDRGIQDCAFYQRHSPLLQNLVHTLKDLLSDAVLFQEMAKVEDRGLIGDPPFHRLDPHLFHQGI